jgi:AcrR family transcriptional regulator
MKKTELHLKRGEKTRRRIIKEAASLFHHVGYSATGLDELLQRLELTKGSFYHHFSSKKEVALAVISEVVAGTVRQRMIDPVVDAPQPLLAISQTIAHLRKDVPAMDLLTGCPLNNLASELALQDKDFQIALAKVFTEWETAWTNALRRELKSGRPHTYKDPRAFSQYLIATIEGAQALAKAQQSRAPLDASLKQLETIVANA